MRKKIPKMHGMSAVLWVEPVKTNPVIPSKRYAKAKARVMADIGVFYILEGGSKGKFGML
jgi:hypothetical protein